MNRVELMEIIRNGESSGVEFKRDDVHPQSMAKEIVSLANLEGGYILLGKNKGYIRLPVCFGTILSPFPALL
jgi:predicted HTH transcriptional regulator